MDTDLRLALGHSQLIDITTTGRRSGQPRRIELVIHNFDGRLFVSGMPMPGRKRAWLANLEADPRLTVHLKVGVALDLPAVARVVTDPAERRPILERIARVWRRTDVDVMVEHSPLIEVVVEGYAADAAA